MRKTSCVLVAMLFVCFAGFAADDPPARIDMVSGELFSIDTTHSTLSFSIGFLGLSHVHGTFKDYGATIVYDDAHPERSSVTVAIDPASIDTGNPQRDKDLKSAKFFDVEKYPIIRFQSTRIEKKGRNEYRVYGNLTMKDVTKEIVIPMTRTVARMPDTAWGNIRIGGTGVVTIRRHDFNIVPPPTFDAGLGDDVEISLDVLGNRPNYEKWTLGPAGQSLYATLASADGAAAAKQLRDMKDVEPAQVGIVIGRLLQHRRVNDALALLETANELWPNNAAFTARLGEVYATLGRRDEAIRSYEKVLQINPHGTEATEMLRRLKG